MDFATKHRQSCVFHDQSHSRCPKAVAYLQGKAAERAAFKEVRSVSNSTSKRAATDARQVYCAQNTQID